MKANCHQCGAEFHAPPSRFAAGGKYCSQKCYGISKRVAVKNVDRGGKCHCGCGGMTSISKTTDVKRARFRGVPMRYIQGHVPTGSKNPRWKGGETNSSDGYALTICRKSSQAGKGFYAKVHVLVAEAALGYALPAGAVVHHVDGDKKNNTSGNLVICQDQSYHALLHARANAIAACGNPNYRKCVFCKQWDDVLNLIHSKSSRAHHHRQCRIDYRRRRQDAGFPF